tara:strand:- start:385 stop:765 length:381 start_codon:yes stop_codon:yes gene_type:complete
MSNYSPRLPLQIDSTNGFANNQTVLQVVQQNLKMLLLTSPGERVMDPNFGVGMRRFLFEQNNGDTHSRIKIRIKRQVSDYMSFIDIEDILFSSETNNASIKSNGLLVTIRFFINPVGIGGSLELEL